MRNTVVTIKPSPIVKLYLLPPMAKLLLALLLCIFISFVGFLYLKQQSVQEAAQLSQKKSMLESDISKNAESYGEMIYISKNKIDAKKQYEDLLQTFPPESQIGDLLANITKLGTAKGIKFVYFKPKPSVTQEYYVETPVEISVIGKFHQLGEFLSEIANLPKSAAAVNQFSLVPNGDLLTLEFTATLYSTLPTSADVKV